MEDLLTAALFLEDVGKGPVHHGIGSADIVEIAFHDIGRRRQQVMHPVTTAGTGAPLRDMYFCLRVFALGDGLSQPSQIIAQRVYIANGILTLAAHRV